MTIVVLDTGALSALAPSNHRARARLRALRERTDDLVVPAAVLAEGGFSGHVGHDYHVRRLLTSVSVVDIDQVLGMAAGNLRSEVMGTEFDPPPSGVDVLVAAVADQRAAADQVEIITSDQHDLAWLAACGANSNNVSILSI